MHTDGKCGVTAKVAFLLAAFCGLPALADGGYVTLIGGSNSSTGFAGATWSEEVENPSTRDYLVSGRPVFYTTWVKTCPPIR